MSYRNAVIVCALFAQTIFYAQPIFKQNCIENNAFYNETQIICFDDTQEVGFISYTKLPFLPYYILHTLYVHPSYRNQGYGTQLLQHACERLHTLGACKIYIQPGPFEINKNGACVKPEEAYEEKLEALKALYHKHGFETAPNIIIYAAHVVYYCARLRENANYLMVQN